MFTSEEISRGVLLLRQGRRKPQRFPVLAGILVVVCGSQPAYAIDFCAGATLTCNGHSASVYCCLTLASNDPDSETGSVDFSCEHNEHFEIQAAEIVLGGHCPLVEGQKQSCTETEIVPLCDNAVPEQSCPDPLRARTPSRDRRIMTSCRAVM